MKAVMNRERANECMQKEKGAGVRGTGEKDKPTERQRVEKTESETWRNQREYNSRAPPPPPACDTNPPRQRLEALLSLLCPSP